MKKLLLAIRNRRIFILATVLGICLGGFFLAVVEHFMLGQSSNNRQNKGLTYFSVAVFETNSFYQSIGVESLGVARKFKLIPVEGTGGYSYCFGTKFAHRGYGSTDLDIQVGVMCEEGADARPLVILGATPGETEFQRNEQTGAQECFVWARKLKVGNSDGSSTEIWVTFHR